MIDIGLPDLLTLVIFAPLVGAVCCRLPAARPARLRSAGRRCGTALVTWVVSLARAALTFDPSAAGLPVRRGGRLDPAFGIQYKLGVDGISLVLVVLTTTPDLDQHPGQLRADQGRA